MNTNCLALYHIEMHGDLSSYNGAFNGLLPLSYSSLIPDTDLCGPQSFGHGT